MLKYNNSYVYNASYNGNTLNTIIYNGVTVWKSPFCNSSKISVSFSRTGSSTTVSLDYNVPLTITSSASWCTVSGTFNEASLNSATSYYKTGTLTVRASENTGNTRSATITIKYGSTTLRTIRVSQEVGETWSISSYHLSIAAMTVNLPYRGTGESGKTYRDTASFSITSYVTETSNLGNTRNTWRDPKVSFSNVSFFDGISYSSGSSTTKTAYVSVWVSYIGQSGIVSFTLGNTQRDSVYIKIA